MQKLNEYKDATDPKSYCDKFIDHSIPDGACVLAQNCYLDDNQILERNGYTMVGDNTGENKPNLGFCTFEQAGTKQLLKINDNALGTAANLFYWTGTGNWVKVTSLTFTAGQPCSMVEANGKVYITNNVDTPKSWNGTTLANVAGIPIVPYIKWFHSFLFALKNSRLYISNRDDPETFGVSSFIDIAPSDGDFMTGAGTIKDELIIGKRYRSFSFQGWTEASFNVTQVNEKLGSYGSTSDLSYVNTGNDLLFMSFGGDIPHIRSIAKTKTADTMYGGIITDWQEGTMKGLSKSQLDKVAAVFDGKYAWFFMPNGSSTYNNLCICYNSVTTGCTKMTGIYAARAVVSSVTGTAKVYFADSRNSKVYVLDGSYSDDGNPIEYRYISKRYQPDFKRFYKFKYLYLQYLLGSTGNLLVRTSVDDHLPDLQETLPLNQPQSMFTYVFPFGFGATTQANKRIDLPYQPTSNIQLDLYKNDITAPVSVHDYTFLGYPKSLRALP